MFGIAIVLLPLALPPPPPVLSPPSTSLRCHSLLPEVQHVSGEGLSSRRVLGRALADQRSLPVNHHAPQTCLHCIEPLEVSLLRGFEAGLSLFSWSEGVRTTGLVQHCIRREVKKRFLLVVTTRLCVIHAEGLYAPGLFLSLTRILNSL